MTLNIEWTNPPDPRPSHHVTAELDQAAATIATRPGEWARLWTGIPTSTAEARVTLLRNRDPRIRARVVTNGCDTADLYATIPAPAAIRIAYDPRFFELPARMAEDQGA